MATHKISLDNNSSSCDAGMNAFAECKSCTSQIFLAAYWR